jgi:hypothetical protein
MALQLFVQLLAMLFCSLSIGLLARKLLLRNLDWSPRVVLFSFFMGFALQILVLLNLVYAGLPVRWTFWLCPAIAVAGYFLAGADFKGAWKASLSLRRESILMVFVLVFVFVAQSISAIWAGHDNYYGLAHIDHFNYTITSEYLRQAEFAGAGEDLQETPWLLRVTHTREQRLGQSVLQAYLGSLSFGSTKDAYAGAVAFCVALLALGAYGLARAISLSRPMALGAALWTGFCPGITQMHLDGFMSQSCSAFVFPWLMLLPLRRLGFFPYVLQSAVPLSFLLTTYTELFPIGIAVLGLATVAAQGISLRSIGSVTGSALLSMVLVPAFLQRAITFLTLQYTSATSRGPQWESLAPDSGTIFGWASILLGVPFVSPGTQYRILVVLGLLLLIACAAGLFSCSLRTRLYLGAITSSVWLFLAILLSNPDFVRYPFQKILVTFAFLWIVLSVYGIAHTAAWLYRTTSIPVERLFVAGTLAVVATLALSGYLRNHAKVFVQEGILKTLGDPALREAFRAGSSNPDNIYLIKETDGLVAAWLSFHTFRSKTFYDAPSLADIPTPSGLYRFSSLPPNVPFTLISRFGVRDRSTRLAKPEVMIYNPQRQDSSGDSFWYWLGDTLTIDIGRWEDATEPKSYALSFVAEPGPANPSPRRVMNLINVRDSTMASLEITGRQELKVPVLLYPGLNKFRLDSSEPTEHLVKIPGDDRKHMTRLFDFSVADGGSNTLPNAAPLTVLAPATPALSVVNPQGKDQAGDKFWYWVGDTAQVKLAIPVDSKERALRLTFRAEAGPANPIPARTVRVRNSERKFERVFSFTGVTFIDVVVPVVPGDNRYLLEVVSPTDQTVKIPGDPRKHMVRVSDLSVTNVRVVAASGPGK